MGVRRRVASRRLGRGSDALDRSAAAPGTAGSRPPTRYVHGDLCRAARLFKAIGAQPEEAYCRLKPPRRMRTRTGTRRPALDFYRRAGASSYADEAALFSRTRPVRAELRRLRAVLRRVQGDRADHSAYIRR
jgi:hypothetical protein